MKDLLFGLLGFPRLASLRDRSPESSEPFVILGFPISTFCLCVHLTTFFGVHTSFFPGSHLRVFRTPWIFRFTWRILSHRYAVPRDETTCACFHLQRKLGEELSLRSFHRNEFVRNVVIRHRIPSFPCNINTIEFVLPQMFWLLSNSPILLPHRKFLLGGVSFNNIYLGSKEWFFSQHVSWTSRFYMTTINEMISEPLREPKNPCWFLRHLLFLQVETLHHRHEILCWVLSLYGGFPPQSGFLEFVVSTW